MKDLLIDRLSKRFGEKQVLSDFSMHIPSGKTLCVMGPSGCGKTTLFRLIAGFITPDSGTISGVPERVSAVFQEDRLCEDFSVLANIRLVTGRFCDEQRIRAHLSEVELERSLKVPVRELSGGMKRRVALVRAVLYGGDLFLLDEPFKGLDERTRDIAIRYLKKNTSSKTVILITHDERVAASLGNCLLRMNAPSR